MSTEKVKVTKLPLNQLLVEQKFCDSIQRANSLVLSGSVLVNENKITKSGFLVRSDSSIRILNIIPEYVSRGAYKLLGAFDNFPISVDGKICMDLGASTGGFTEVLLNKKAFKVYSIDVGYGQLADRLRRNPKVKVIDRYNVKEVSLNILEEETLELFITMDLSFISLLKIYPAIQKMKREKRNLKIEVVSLIKPQFECESIHLEKGILRNPKIHYQVLCKIYRYIQKELKGKVLGLCSSPILGTSGNKEFLIYFSL